MKKLTILRPWISIAILFSFVNLSLAQNQPVANKPPLVLTLTHEADGIFVTPSGAVNEFVFEAFLLSGQRVYASEPISGTRVKLQIQNAEGKPLSDGQYLYITTTKVSPTTMVKYFGKLTIQSGKAEMQDSSVILSGYERHYFAQRNLSFAPDTKQADIDREFQMFQAKAKAAVEFFDLVVRLIPNSAEALLGQGFAIAATAGLTVSQMTELIIPPTPPPPPPPGSGGKQTASDPPPPQARQPEIKREGLLRAAEAFQQAAQVGDCQSRAEAYIFVSTLYVTLNEAAKAREWRLKGATMDCAGVPTRAMAYYALAVESWSCANEITERYTDQKRALYTDPWYPRQISSPADQAKLDACLARGTEYIEKALALEPDNANAVVYQSLLYREKQKMAKTKAERFKYAALAEKAMQRAMKLFERERKKP